MPLESLLKLVETLGDRMEEHGSELRQSEALTRYALIDPLLRELGWDTTDPALVIPEYQSGNGRADYALIVSGNPAMMVEAKKLGDDLHDRARTQGVQYCIEKGTKHFAVTDGQRWEIYETHRPVPIDEKRVVELDLKSQSPSEVCLKALALWRPSVESGRVAGGEAPVIGLRRGPPSAGQPLKPIRREGVEDPDWREWDSLAEATASKGQNPTTVIFPEGGAVEVKNWATTLVEVVRWLTESGKLQARHCPIIGSSNPRAFRYMVHTQPLHSNGDPFTSPVEVNDLWVEKHDNRQALINKIRAIVKHVSQDPASIRVRVS